MIEVVFPSFFSARSSAFPVGSVGADVGLLRVPETEVAGVDTRGSRDPSSVLAQDSDSSVVEIDFLLLSSPGVKGCRNSEVRQLAKKELLPSDIGKAIGSGLLAVDSSRTDSRIGVDAHLSIFLLFDPPSDSVSLGSLGERERLRFRFGVVSSGFVPVGELSIMFTSAFAMSFLASTTAQDPTSEADLLFSIFLLFDRLGLKSEYVSPMPLFDSMDSAVGYSSSAPFVEVSAL